MYNNKKVTVVIPCYNEETGIKEVCCAMPSFIDEIIVVDNNSDDNTADVAKRYGAKVLFVKKRGYGLAYQRGLSEAGGDIIIMIDGDNSYPISEAEKFLFYMEMKNYSFLSGCRFPLTCKRAMPFLKRLSNYFFSYLVRKCFRINLIDSLSGMIVFKSCLLKEILPLNPGMGFSHEIKIKAWLNPSIQSGELHINYNVRSGVVKFSSVQDSIKILCDTLFFFRNHVNKNKFSLSKR